MPITYSGAPEVRRLVTRLIAAEHTRLDDQKVVVVFRSEAATRNGRQVLGAAKKVSGLGAFLAQVDDDEAPDEQAPFFVLVVGLDSWRLLKEEQREALIDHLLSCCGVEESENGTRLFIAGPEAAEFAGVMKRHGAWRDELEGLLKAAANHQPSLFTQGDADPSDLEDLEAAHDKGDHDDYVAGCAKCDDERDAITVLRPVAAAQAERASRRPPARRPPTGTTPRKRASRAAKP
jgi:hypothetical protein